IATIFHGPLLIYKDGFGDRGETRPPCSNLPLIHQSQAEADHIALIKWSKSLAMRCLYLGRISILPTAAPAYPEWLRPFAAYWQVLFEDHRVRSAGHCIEPRVSDPLVTVPVHVIKTPGVRLFLSNGMRLLPGRVRGVPRIIVDFFSVISPRIRRCCPRTTRVFPLCLRRQAILPTLLQSLGRTLDPGKLRAKLVGLVLEN